jgi:hypothetical protein
VAVWCVCGWVPYERLHTVSEESVRKDDLFWWALAVVVGLLWVGGMALIAAGVRPDLGF